MKLSKSIVLFLGLSVFFAVGSFSGPVASADDTQPQKALVCESPDNVYGDSDFVGSPSKSAEAASDELSEVFGSHRDSWAGVSFCRDYSGILVYVVDVNDPSVGLIDSIAKKYPDVKIHVVRVKYSSLQLEAAQEALLERDSSPTLVVSPDPQRGRVLVEGSVNMVDSGSARVRSVKIPSMSRARSVEKVPKPEVPVLYVRGELNGQDAATRGNDTAPFTAGADIRSEGLMCSLGPRVKVKGKYMMLTAGHCPGGTHYTPFKKSVGNQYTTAYPGNANKYGDWKLISGKSYSGNVYNSGNASSSRHVGVGLNLGGLAKGRGLCTSGRTTGQLCGFVVNSTYASVRIDGVSANHQTKISKREGRINSHGCNGFRGGDSGGPAYYNNGSGKMIYAGLVKGTTWWKAGSQKRCTYYVTQLSGVRKWAGAVSW